MTATVHIQYLSGAVESRALSRDQPLAIGRHPTCDVVLDEEGVGPLHCRIGWSREFGTYEVSAAVPTGVELNGRPVRRAPLGPGDVLRIGSADVTFLDGDAAADAAEVSALPDDFWQTDDVPPSDAEPATIRAPAPDAANDLPAARSTRRPLPRRTVPVEVESDETEGEALGPPLPPLQPRTVAEPSLVAQLKSRLETGPRRPGEQTVLRSPFVLGLGGGALLLLLVAGIVWFLIARQAAQRMYDAALTEMAQQRYAEAIRRFDAFLNEHPTHPLAAAARVQRDRARVEQPMAAQPEDWPAALEALNQFIRLHRDDDDFGRQSEAICDLSFRLALGAAATAVKTKQRPLLAITDEARQLLLRYSPPDEPPTKLEQRIDAERARATDAVRKHETFAAATAEMRRANAARRPMDALAMRRRLLERFPEVARDRQVVELLQQTRAAEKDLVAAEEIALAAAVDERDDAAPTAWTRVVTHHVGRDDEAAAGRVVAAVAQGCCYGLDAATGRPLWRRVIGFDSPFFPIAVPSAMPGLLTFDTRHNEVILVARDTGRLLWRLPLDEPAAGPPLVHDGQILLTTRGRHLLRIDLETGRATARLTFSQPLATGPVLLRDGEHLAAVGESELLYVLSTRPLECRQVAHLGHRPAAVATRPLPLGRWLLVAENDHPESCRLRVLDGDAAGTLGEVGAARVPGTVRDEPELWGNLLLVPSGAERITAFTVSDRAGEPPLTRLATQKVPEIADGAMYLSAGPDGQFWLASHALKKFQLEGDAIKLQDAPGANGAAAGPLQALDRYLILGRHSPLSAAVLVARFDRETLVGDWQTTLGARVIAWTGGGDNPLVGVSETGDVLRVTAADVRAGGFGTSTTPALKLPADLTEPLRATTLADGRIAVHCGGAQPKLWLVSATGQIERSLDLPAPLETHPVVLPRGIVLPLPGRLRLIPVDSDEGTVEDYIAPLGQNPPAAWAWLGVIDDTQLLAIDGTGRVLRIEARDSPVRHLFEVTGTSLGAAVDVAPILHDGQLLVAAGRRLRAFDVSTLETLAETELPQPASNALWSIGNRLLVETGRDTLRTFDLTADLKPGWTVPLAPSVGLPGPPLRLDNRLILAQRDGTLQTVDWEAGTPQQRQTFPLPLTGGPRQIGDVTVVPTLDGSLYRLDPFPPAE